MAFQPLEGVVPISSPACAVLRKFASYSTRGSALGAGSSLRVMPAMVSMVTCQVLSPRTTPPWTISRPAGRDAGFQPFYTRSAGAAPVRRRRLVDPGCAIAGTLFLIALNVSFLASHFSFVVDTPRKTWGWPWTAAASLRKVARWEKRWMNRACDHERGAYLETRLTLNAHLQAGAAAGELIGAREGGIAGADHVA